MFVTAPNGTGETWDEVPIRLVRPAATVKMQLRDGTCRHGIVKSTLQQWIVLEGDANAIPVEEIVRLEIDRR